MMTEMATMRSPEPSSTTSPVSSVTSRPLASSSAMRALVADHGRPVGRAEVAQDVAFAAEDDARVLAGHQLVGEHHVVVGGAPEAHHVRGRLENLTERETLCDLELDHLLRAKARGRERQPIISLLLAPAKP